jgi:hypothetical protein
MPETCASIAPLCIVNKVLKGQLCGTNGTLMARNGHEAVIWEGNEQRLNLY